MADEELENDEILRLTKELRKKFQHIIAEPIPDDIERLLTELEQTSKLLDMSVE